MVHYKNYFFSKFISLKNRCKNYKTCPDPIVLHSLKIHINSSQNCAFIISNSKNFIHPSPLSPSQKHFPTCRNVKSRFRMWADWYESGNYIWGRGFFFSNYSTHIHKLMGKVSKARKREKKAKVLKHADDTEQCWKNLLNLSHSIITCHIELIQWNGEKVHYLERAIFFAWCVISSLLLLLNIYGIQKILRMFLPRNAEKKHFLPVTYEKILFFLCHRLFMLYILQSTVG